MRYKLATLFAALMLAGCTTAQEGGQATTGSAEATTASAYAGTWQGNLPSGKPVQLVIPANVESGGRATYFYDGKRQGLQTASKAGNQLRLDNPGRSHLLIGPVSGNSLPYYWTDGSNEARTTMRRVK